MRIRSISAEPVASSRTSNVSVANIPFCSLFLSERSSQQSLYGFADKSFPNTDVDVPRIFLSSAFTSFNLLASYSTSKLNAMIPGLLLISTSTSTVSPASPVTSAIESVASAAGASDSVPMLTFPPDTANSTSSKSILNVEP